VKLIAIFIVYRCLWKMVT